VHDFAASGLYYLSEIVEEYTVLAKRVLLRVIYFVIGLLFFAWVFDRLPFTLTLLSIISHVIYLGNMRRFPYVQLTDPLFLASCGKTCPSPAKYSYSRLLIGVQRARHA